jgi:hypothetical protein
VNYDLVPFLPPQSYIVGERPKSNPAMKLAVRILLETVTIQDWADFWEYAQTKEDG